MLNWKHHPTHGFRFSAIDAIAILVCAVATAWGLAEIGSLAWVFPFVLAHFFLFCNVFRVRRRPELIWAIGFLLLTAGCLTANVSVLHAMWMVLPVTAAVLVHAVRQPSYHGVGSKSRALPTGVTNVEEAE